MGRVLSTRRSESLELCLPHLDAALSPSRNVCAKNGNHTNFIRPDDLGVHHLPEQLRHDTVIKWLRLEMDRTVKIVVERTSEGRPPGDQYSAYKGKDLARVATGRAWPQEIQENPLVCPLKNCPYASQLGQIHHAFGYLQILTNKHIVYDHFEASNTVIEFFFDSDDDRSDVVMVHGVSVDYDIAQEDTSIIHCVFHDKNLPQYLYTEEVWACLRDIPQWVRDGMSRHVFVISHPHGYAKRVTVGEIVDRQRPWSERSWLFRWLSFLFRSCSDFEDGCVTSYTAQTCPGSSGGSVLVVMNKRFCWPISHCAYDETKKLNVSHSYFK